MPRGEVIIVRIKSPLSNLSEVLRQVNTAGQLYQATLAVNEAATRAVLIDPILRALGWDTANTHMVEVEKTLGQVRADYALYDSNAAVRIIIEAKAFNSNLNQPTIIMSLVNYAFAFELQDVFLTDGIKWQHYTNFQPGGVLADKVLDLANDDPIECAAYLVQWLDAAKFWSEEQTIDALAQQVAQLENTVATLQRDVAQLQDTASASPMAITIPSPSVSANNNNESAANFVELDKIDFSSRRKPKLLRLPDGTLLTISAWKDILRECCKFALARNPSIRIPFPDRAGRKVSLFNTVQPRTGISYVTEQYRGQTIYIYINYDARNCVANALYVLRQAPITDQQVEPAVSLD
jgi:predicted type IV restriction endonuclease